MSLPSPAEDFAACWQSLGLPPLPQDGSGLAAHSPIDGSRLATVPPADAAAIEAAIADAGQAFLHWRSVPAPRRGELVRLLGEELRQHKAALGRLVSLEAGKILSEGLGEVQETIDICDFAVGLSRQLYGLTMTSERPGHRMMETWHPLGPAAVITAFNFPVAVWSWNAALALVCGNPVLWKPSEKTPLTALAMHSIALRAMQRFGSEAPPGLLQLLQGDRRTGEALVVDPRIALVSATGSTAMGRQVGAQVAGRFGRSLLELGGNNGAIVTPSADLDLAVRAIAFSAMGTAGQRCTTLRRLFVHDSVADNLLARLKAAYASVAIGDPRAEGTLVGPLIDAHAATAMQSALDTAAALGARIHGGEVAEGPGSGRYRRPALVEMPQQCGPMLEETFAPILYVTRYRHLSDAIAAHNASAHGLSSSIFTQDLREAELFVSAAGSDCGIANVNIGPSGAEIGGAFGGEKATGGGRESGSDSWRAYMRRATNTVNYSGALPLAQGVKFDL